VLGIARHRDADQPLNDNLKIRISCSSSSEIVMLLSLSGIIVSRHAFGSTSSRSQF
jgi:hypothetical protein